MSKPRLLIVDDEIAIRTALHRWFLLHEFDADCASNGLEAVNLCRINAYDLVTIDLDMPLMGGLEAIPLIREIHPQIPIVVLTGYAKDTGIALAKGAQRVCVKPLRLSELEAQVRSVLAGN